MSKGNGIFFTKIKNAETKWINQVKREGFTDYNAINRKEKDQIEPKLQSFEYRKLWHAEGQINRSRDIKVERKRYFFTKIKNTETKWIDQLRREGLTDYNAINRKEKDQIEPKLQSFE